MGNYKNENHCACQEALANVGPQNAFNVVAILFLPSHGNFEKEKSKSITNQNLLQLSCKLHKETPISDQEKTDKKLETLGV
jgi:hypothetical protein